MIIFLTYFEIASGTFCRTMRDTVESLIALNIWRFLVRDDWRQRGKERVWRGLGRFARGYRGHRTYNIMDEIENEMAGESESWVPLRAGLFDGNLARAQAVKSSTDKEINEYMIGRRDIYEI